MIYKIGMVKTEVFRIVGDVVTTVPFDPANADYQEYLKWLSEGNTPEPAEEVTN